MDIDVAKSILEEDDRFKVLNRVDIRENHVFSGSKNEETTGSLAVIDTETTGFSPDAGDRIIDLAIAVCEYGQQSGKLYKVTKRYEALEDPEMSIPLPIQNLTGITDDLVRGSRIKEEAVAQVLENVNLIVCHNAAFDRPFLESRFPSFGNKHFSCSLKEIPWDEWGFASHKLDYLGYRFGLFHDGHRARTDVDMLLSLLSKQEPGETTPILGRLLQSARKVSFRIFAIGLPYDQKDYAKARGYRWNDGRSGDPKAWWIDSRDKDEELKFLEKLGCLKPIVLKLSSKERYRSQFKFD